MEKLRTGSIGAGDPAARDRLVRANLRLVVNVARNYANKGVDMADLIAHIGSLGPQPQRKAFEDNKPHLVRAGKDNTLLLLAANAEIYGPTLILASAAASVAGRKAAPAWIAARTSAASNTSRERARPPGNGNRAAQPRAARMRSAFPGGRRNQPLPVLLVQQGQKAG